MVIVVMTIMAMAGFSFLLKLTCHGWTGRIGLCLISSLFVLATYESATAQSKTQIADWLNQPDLMLDTSVWVTIDVTFQVCFCVLSAKRLGGRLTRKESMARLVCLWFPGLLIFPALFASLTELVFSMPGTDFALIGWGTAGGILILVPLLAYALKLLLPEPEIRLELIFMVNMLIAILSIVATVNGRTAATGTNSVEWPALAGVLAILSAGTAVGMILNKFITANKISKLK